MKLEKLLYLKDLIFVRTLQMYLKDQWINFYEFREFFSFFAKINSREKFVKRPFVKTNPQEKS